VIVAAVIRGLAPTAFQLISPPKVLDFEYYDGLLGAESGALHVVHAAEHSELACQAEQPHQGLRGVFGHLINRCSICHYKNVLRTDVSSALAIINKCDIRSLGVESRGSHTTIDDRLAAALMFKQNSYVPRGI
jgi:hypothetical protein